MQEASSTEVEKVLLFISDARDRAKKARDRLGAGETDQHVLEALDRAEQSLSAAHRALMQGTYFAVPERNEQLAVWVSVVSLTGEDIRLRLSEFVEYAPRFDWSGAGPLRVQLS